METKAAPRSTETGTADKIGDSIWYTMRMKFPISTVLLIIVLGVFALALGYNYVWRPFSNQVMVAVQEPAAVASDSAELATDDLVRKWVLDDLTPEQRVGQMLFVPISLDDKIASLSAVLSETSKLQPGGYLLFGSDIDAIFAKRSSDEIRQSVEQAGIPVILAIDHEGGTVQRLYGNGFLSLPSAQALCKLEPTEQAELLAQSAQEVSLAGIQMVFGPDIDVASRSAVLETRVCSGDPQVVSEYGARFVSAFTKYGVLPVLKHYPGIGSTTKDLHSSFDQQIVLSKDVMPFRYILDQNPQIGVMISHMGVLNQIPELPCSQSADCIDQLRSTNPQALIISDSLTMKAAAYNGQEQKYSKSLETIALSAVFSGNQMLVFGPDATPEQLQQVVDALVAQYTVDDNFASKVDAAVARILDAKEFQIFK